MTPTRRKTPSVRIGNITIGSDHPVAIQSMTNTPTADTDATYAQIRQLIQAGSELVRITVNDDAAARSAVEIKTRLRKEGIETPLIGDFHYNGHILLTKYPDLAVSLDKYRINPGNVGRGAQRDERFTAMIKTAVQHDKAVRIGVNSGSLDQEFLAELMSANAAASDPLPADDIVKDAMVKSALHNARHAEELGLSREHIVLSVKMSGLQETVNVYTDLAARSDYALHLGLTEAGSGLQGIISSTAALSILLEQGIGDTIRVSLTPDAETPRDREVEICRHILQSLGLRSFFPKVVSCPGCGRAGTDTYLRIAADIKSYIQSRLPVWQEQRPGAVNMTVAVMGCVVNGPGESRSADIGLSLPGQMEEPAAPVYIRGKKTAVLKGEKIVEDFRDIIEEFVKMNY